MNLRDFLTHPIIRLPILRDTDDFQSFVEKRLDAYLALLEEISGPPQLVDELQGQTPGIGAFCHSAKEIVRSFLAGHPYDAYTHFLEGIPNLLPSINKLALKDLGQDDFNLLYRVRKQVSPPLDREGIFHIPFQDRHKVGTQRYSIPGLPCLYLGGSLYTCWAEMGRPPFHELQAAAFWLKSGQTIKVLNLSNRPARLLLYIDPEGGIPPTGQVSDLFATHLTLWPLMALCSIVVKHRDSPFKPEYILPQIVLQWVTQEHNFDGICYFSTNVPAVTNHPLPPCNLVFPVREIRDKGRCPSLRRLFKMTQPYSWELLRAVQGGEGMTGHAIPNFEFEFIEGRKEPYSHTEFGMVQSKLNKMALDISYSNNQGETDLGDVEE